MIVFLRTIFRTLFGLTAVLAVAGVAAAPTEPSGARRVVSLAPSLTELVYAAGAQRQLVGVSAYSDFPDAAKLLPQIADASGISFEALLALKPDLVLAWKSGTRPADIARLASLGINTVEIDIASLADIPRAVRTIGRLVERAPGDNTPEIFATTFATTLENLRKASGGKTPVRTFFEISQLPMMTVNARHYITETIKLCGGENIFADAAQLVVEPSREELLKRGADVILRPTSIHKDSARDRALYAGLEAYRRGRIYAVNADWILRPGPRVLLAAAKICTALDRSRGD